MPHDELNTRRNLLSAAYEVYWNGISGCEIPPPDRVPLRIKEAVSSFVGSARVSCPPTYKLLSCGLLNVRTSGSYDTTMPELLSPRSRQQDRLSASMLSVCLFVCLSVAKMQKNASFSKLSNLKSYWRHIGSRTWAFQRTHYWTPKIQDGWDPPSWKSTWRHFFCWVWSDLDKIS